MSYHFDSVQHVHTLDGSPLVGTSTVVKEVLPPFLAKWGAQCAVDYIREKAPLVGVPPILPTGTKIHPVHPDTLDEAVSAWTKVRGQKADDGTALHAALEEYVKLCIGAGGGEPVGYGDGNEKVAKFAEWSGKYVERFIFAEKNTYSKELWVGGQVDCLALLKSGLLVVIDFKSSREAYFNSFVQCAGYATQLDESGYGEFDGSNWHKLPQPVGGLVIIPFGGKTLKPVLIENVSGYKEVFAHCLAVYKFQQSYREKGGTILVD